MTRSMVVVWLCAFVACGDDGPALSSDAAILDAPPDAPPDPPVMAMMMIDEDGGSVTTPNGEAEITIPPESVDGDTMITIAASTAPPPAGALGPVYQFGPAGLVFARPVTISLALPAGLADADIYWSKPAGASGYDNVGGTIEGGKVTTQIVHFSEGFVGAAQTARTVTGSQKVGWVSASGFKLIPTDLSTFAVAALVDNGSGGYTAIPGVGHSDGTFTIDNVPDGPYWLRVPGTLSSSAYYRTTANAVDAGYTAQGRPDAVALTTPTPLDLTVTNLAPWQAGDQIEMFSTENYSWYFQAEASAGNVPAVDATELANFTFDLSLAYAGTPHVIEGNHVPPDRFVVAQLARRTTTSNVSYNAMSRIFEPAPFTVTAGQTTSLTGAFTDVATGSTLALDIKAAAIRASLAEESRPCSVPSNWPYGWTIYVLGVAGGLQHGITGATADFLALDLPIDSPDVAGTDFTYGAPLQGTWGIYGDARFLQPCEFTPPGATSATMLNGGVGLYVAESVQQFGAGPLSVRLSQVRAPTINGNSLYSANTGIGLTPTLAWQAPTIGTPSFYEVEVWRIYADGDGAGQNARVAYFISDQTTLTLPAGVLATGQSYVFGISARKSSRSDASAFNREVLPEYAARILSLMQQP